MLPRARIKSEPDDFVVDEIPLYEPAGAGEHVYVRFRKRDLTTDDAVRMLARALGANARDAGVAGMKDKRAVTTQTVSFSLPGAAVPDVPPLEGITVLDVRRHGNKLRTGHLRANRFTIIVRDIEGGRAEEVAATLARAARDGVPNAFGMQRFGREGDNAARARAFLTGQEPGPRDGRQRRFLFSALQSALFNAVLARRVQDGTWATPLEGDVLRKNDSGGLFVCEDVATDRERASRLEVSPTGPMFGAKMPAARGVPGAIEQDVLAAELGGTVDFAAHVALGEGARRPLRLEVEALSVDVRDGNTLEVCFVLPKGAYATTVLATAVVDSPSAPVMASTRETDD